MRKIAETSSPDSGRSGAPRSARLRDNPFAVSTELTAQRGVFGDAARCLRSGLLYREIEFGSPFAGVLVYSGWWFRQKIEINGETVWFRISWMQIFRHAAFTISPAAIPPAAIGEMPSVRGAKPGVAGRIEPGVAGRIEIDFTRGLMIRRFRLWIADELVYDEIN